MRGLWMLAVSAALLHGVASAQDAGTLRHPDDKYVPADAAAPASNWKGQPWWVALAECAASFRTEPANKTEFQKFAGYAMMRLADDRKIKAEDAAAIVIPWTGGRGMERANTMISFFGIEAVRTNCAALMVQYQAN